MSTAIRHEELSSVNGGESPELERVEPVGVEAARPRRERTHEQDGDSIRDGAGVPQSGAQSAEGVIQPVRIVDDESSGCSSAAAARSAEQTRRRPRTAPSRRPSARPSALRRDIGLVRRQRFQPRQQRPADVRAGAREVDSASDSTPGGTRDRHRLRQGRARSAGARSFRSRPRLARRRARSARCRAPSIRRSTRSRSPLRPTSSTKRRYSRLDPDRND